MIRSLFGWNTRNPFEGAVVAALAGYIRLSAISGVQGFLSVLALLMEPPKVLWKNYEIYLLCSTICERPHDPERLG